MFQAGRLYLFVDLLVDNNYRRNTTSTQAPNHLEAEATIASTLAGLNAKMMFDGLDNLSSPTDVASSSKAHPQLMSTSWIHGKK